MDSLVIGVGGSSLRQDIMNMQLHEQHRVRLFERADEALFFMLQQEPELVIADYRLPDIDGLSFLYRVRRVQPDALRILCGVDAATQRLTSAALNLFACIDANAESEVLIAAVNRALPNSYAANDSKYDVASEVDQTFSYGFSAVPTTQ